MKLLHFKQNNQSYLAVKTERGILNIQKAVETLNCECPVTLEDLILQGESGLFQMNKLIDLAITQNTPDLFMNENQITYGPSVINPEKIICVGLNYVDHAEESKMEIPTSPILFSKFSNTLEGHNGKVKLPADAEKFDYEAELVVVIGKTASNVSEEEALSYIFGYSAGNDLSARDLQFRTGQWLLGKSSDGFAPIGPYLITSEEIQDPQNLSISCTVNGETRQQANTKDMIFSCANLVCYISKYMTLKPGDVIFTGTPQGVILGYAEQDQIWLKAGDKISVTIENIGTLTNTLEE
ncbi:fumarylacetoacetate hydrolase family protein [Neobacillus cucumis]|uniref:5-carboxymethyl-2-hydroxymuconate isomerase n=1 Tax=Neobacillus cucumis TaxID=1740721 RepID=A0A2N5HTR4_9BACI|nr:fumarylacetoacetate hydrolase family protein [Neobacillus cucumis]PLS08908.1 5-carboxymethyl-2-hydroxymuconate isomerase [Neobacillus cucumis]